MTKLLLQPRHEVFVLETVLLNQSSVRAFERIAPAGKTGVLKAVTPITSNGPNRKPKNSVR